MRIAIALGAMMALGCGSATGRSSDGGVADMAVASGPEANPPKLATLTLQSFFFSGFAMASAAATFSTYDGGMSGPCTVEPAGACRLRSCPRDSDMGGIAMAPMRTNVGAGTVTLTGPAGMMPLTMNADGSYGVSLGTSEPWMGGETFSMTTTGDVAPALTATILAPSRPTMQSPARPMPNAPPVAVTRSSGLPVTWTPTSPGTLTLQVFAQTPTAFLYLLCDAPASAGSYTIAPDALAMVPADATNPGVTGNVATSSTMMVGDWQVAFTAENVPNDAAQNLPWIFGISWQ